MARPDERVGLTFGDPRKCRDDAWWRGERIYRFSAEYSRKRRNGCHPLRAHSGNELELSQVGKWQPHLRRRWLPHLLGRPGRAIGRTKRDIRTRRIAGIASFNDTLGDVVRRGLRSANRAQERRDNFGWRFSNVDARNFYARLGYSQAELLPGYYGGRETSVRMAKELGSTQKGTA